MTFKLFIYHSWREISHIVIFFSLNFDLHYTMRLYCDLTSRKLFLIQSHKGSLDYLKCSSLNSSLGNQTNMVYLEKKKPLGSVVARDILQCDVFSYNFDFTMQLYCDFTFRKHECIAVARERYHNVTFLSILTLHFTMQLCDLTFHECKCIHFCCEGHLIIFNFFSQFCILLYISQVQIYLL